MAERNMTKKNEDVMTVKNSQQSLFILEDDKVHINPKALVISEFSDLWERDKSPGKKKAIKEFAYIYYIADYKSEYLRYGLSMETQLGIDIFQNRNYKPDPMVKIAIVKYEQLQETPSMRYLKSVRKRVNGIIDYLDTAQIKDTKMRGEETVPENPFISIDKITATMSKVEDIIETVEKWEKKVFDEEEEMKIRGGGMLNAFEDPESAKWLGR
jgi:hypothetical protein